MIGDLYVKHIQEPGKEPLFWMLVAFLLTFAFIRLSVWMIRKQVRWWPGNIESSGGLHIHHLVFGIFMMLGAGVLEFGADPDGTGTTLLAALFGAGAALTLDEYALWLRLKDVYWAKEGRQSVDAVILVGLTMMLLLIGLSPLGVNDVDDQSRSALAYSSGLILLNVIFTLVAVLKGKVFTAIVGMFVPLVSLIGSIRLAHPNSPWAHRRYRQRPSKMVRAERRYARDRLRINRARHALTDWITGTGRA